MADIKLDNIGEDRTEQERAKQAERAEEEETSFTENTDNTDYDNIRSLISSESATQSETNTEHGDFDSTDLERQIQDHAVKRQSKDTTQSKRLNQRRARDLA